MGTVRNEATDPRVPLWQSVMVVSRAKCFGIQSGPDVGPGESGLRQSRNAPPGCSSWLAFALAGCRWSGCTTSEPRWQASGHPALLSLVPRAVSKTFRSTFHTAVAMGLRTLNLPAEMGDSSMSNLASMARVRLRSDELIQQLMHDIRTTEDSDDAMMAHTRPNSKRSLMVSAGARGPRKGQRSGC